MKNILYSLIAYLISVSYTNAQLTAGASHLLEPHEYGGFQQNLFLLNQGIARSEAMGKTAVAEGNSIVYSLYNPALLGTLKNFEVQGGTMQPNSIYDDGYYVNASAGMRYLNRFASSVSFQKMRSEAIDLTDEIGNIILTTHAVDLRMNLSTAYLLLDKPKHKLDFGLGLNYTSSVPYNQIKYEGGTIDLGLNYRTQTDSIHYFTIGLSANNLTNQRIWLADEADGVARKHPLPQVLRSGISYRFKPGWTVTKFNLRILESTLHAQYDEIINSDYYTTWKAGVEFKLLEVLFLRGGYFKGNGATLIGTYAYTGDNYSQFEAITYGGGVEIPLTARDAKHHEIILGLDFTQLPFPNYDDDIDSRRIGSDVNSHFSMLNARLVWNLK